MKRLNIYTGLMITFMLVLPVTWVCRNRVILPVDGDGVIYSLHEVSLSEGMVDIKLHSGAAGQMPGAGIGDKGLDVFEGDVSGFGNKNQGSFSPSAPRVVSSRSRNTGESDGAKAGLFGDDSLNSFSGIDGGTGSGSWGWLAEDVKSASRDRLERDDRFESRRDDRRLFGNDDDSFGRSFGSDRKAVDDSFFRRQDLRW